MSIRRVVCLYTNYFKIRSPATAWWTALNSNMFARDTRDLYDDGSSALQDYMKMIGKAYALMQQHDRVVICCVAGMSRSNAVALGVLVKYFKITGFASLFLLLHGFENSSISWPHY